MCCHCLSSGELRSVAEVAVNSTKPLQGSRTSMSSEEVRLEASTAIRFTSPCYLNQYYRIPQDCQSGLCSLLNSINLILFFSRCNAPKSSEGTGKRAHQATFTHSPAVLVNRSTTWWKISKYNAHLQVGLEGWSGELPARQPDLSTWKVMEIFLSITIQHIQGLGQANKRQVLFD